MIPCNCRNVGAPLIRGTSSGDFSNSSKKSFAVFVDSVTPTAIFTGYWVRVVEGNRGDSNNILLRGLRALDLRGLRGRLRGRLVGRYGAQ